MTDRCWRRSTPVWPTFPRRAPRTRAPTVLVARAAPRLAIPGGALVASAGVSDGAGGAGTVFGLLRPSGGAAWAHLDRPGGQLTVHDLPGGDPDAPPPQLVLRRGSPDRTFLLYSESAGARTDAGHARDAGAPALSLVLASVTGDAVAPVAHIPEPRDDSLDADLAFAPASAASAGLVVWDDDDPFARFGRIRAARLDGDGHVAASEPLILTPAGTDAESPQVVATRTGFVVVYRVRRGEDRDAGLVEEAVEAPGERRAFHWLEAVVVPANPALPVSSPRVLTSPTAHVGAFVLSAEPRGDDSFDLVVRDDDAPRDAAGGRLLAIRFAADFVSAPATSAAPHQGPSPDPVTRVLAPAGVGSGALSFLSPFVVYAGEDDAAHLVALDAPDALDRSSRSEPALAGADPVSLAGPEPTFVTFSLERGGASSITSVSCR